MELVGYAEVLALVAGTVVAGVVAHELSHAVALRLAGVGCTVDVLPARNGDGRQSAGMGTALARVRPTGDVADVSPTHLRLAALTPLGLSLPLVLVLLGVVPDPFASGAVGRQAALVVWVGCSIPSPQDFSLAWHPERAIELATDGSGATSPG